MNRKKKFLTGFTLIELMIVMAVIAILVGIILPNIKGMQQEAQISRAKGELRTLQTAVESYYIHSSNTYPPTTTTLCASYLNSATPRIVEDPAYDPFGDSATEEYNYIRSSDGNYYAIWSEGPAGNGAVSAVADSTGDVTETNGSSCIFVANGDKDSTP